MAAGAAYRTSVDICCWRQRAGEVCQRYVVIRGTRIDADKIIITIEEVGNMNV